MNAVQRLSRELDRCLSDIAFSGLRNVQSSILEKIALLSGTMTELGMEKGASLLLEFAGALRRLRTGGEGNEVAALLCRIDFYNRYIAGNMENRE